MGTPCEEKGYEVGQVFKCVEGNGNWIGDLVKGAIAVLVDDDRTVRPEFLRIDDGKYSQGWACIRDIVRIYPPEPAETIELMGKTYDKAEIEQALSSVKALGE